MRVAATSDNRPKAIAVRGTSSSGACSELDAVAVSEGIGS